MRLRLFVAIVASPHQLPALPRPAQSHEQVRRRLWRYHRPHGGLGGQTPYERLIAKTRAGVLPAS